MVSGGARGCIYVPRWAVHVRGGVVVYIKTMEGRSQLPLDSVVSSKQPHLPHPVSLARSSPSQYMRATPPPPPTTSHIIFQPPAHVQLDELAVLHFWLTIHPLPPPPPPLLLRAPAGTRRERTRYRWCVKEAESGAPSTTHAVDLITLTQLMCNTERGCSLCSSR
jgi:hypothetical protein